MDVRQGVREVVGERDVCASNNRRTPGFGIKQNAVSRARASFMFVLCFLHVKGVVGGRGRVHLNLL